MYEYSDAKISSAIEVFLINSMCRVVDLEFPMEILETNLMWHMKCTLSWISLLEQTCTGRKYEVMHTNYAALLSKSHSFKQCRPSGVLYFYI
jgi:hypothetical protein